MSTWRSRGKMRIFSLNMVSIYSPVITDKYVFMTDFEFWLLLLTRLDVHNDLCFTRFSFYKKLVHKKLGLSFLHPTFLCQ